MKIRHALALSFLLFFSCYASALVKSTPAITAQAQPGAPLGLKVVANTCTDSRFIKLLDAAVKRPLMAISSPVILLLLYPIGWATDNEPADLHEEFWQGMDAPIGCLPRLVR